MNKHAKIADNLCEYMRGADTERLEQFDSQLDPTLEHRFFFQFGDLFYRHIAPLLYIEKDILDD